MSRQDDAKYAEMFAKINTEDGYLSGKRAAGLFGKSGLPREILARVWALSDQDSDGKLSLEVGQQKIKGVFVVQSIRPTPEYVLIVRYFIL